MKSARDIMHTGAECIGPDEKLASAARLMRDQHVGALPVCDGNGHLTGIITDRDIVVRCVAEGKDPKSLTAGQLIHGRPASVDADADISQVLRVMEERRVRRVPVMDKQRVIGMISEADLATHLSEDDVTEFTAAVYSAPPNN